VYVEGVDQQSYPISIEFEGKAYSATYTLETGVVEVSSLYGSEEMLQGGSDAQYGSTLACRSFLKQALFVRLYLTYNVSVIDAKTMQVVALRYDKTLSQNMGKEFCKDQLNELTPAELQEIEVKLKQMLKNSIPERLEKLSL
jgi:hypothetical protein